MVSFSPSITLMTLRGTMKFIVLFLSLISVSHSAEYIKQLVGFFAMGKDPVPKERIYSAPFEDDFIEKNKNESQVKVALIGSNLKSTWPLIGYPNPKTNARYFQAPTTEPYDDEALKVYYECLNYLARDLFKFTLRDQGAVVDLRGFPLIGEHCQIWFTGKVVLRLSFKNMAGYQDCKKDPIQVGYLGFDTPLGYKPILSFTTQKLSNYMENLRQSYDLSPIKYNDMRICYELKSFKIGNTLFILHSMTSDVTKKGLVLHLMDENASPYKEPHQYVRPCMVNKIYQNLFLPHADLEHNVLSLNPNQDRTNQKEKESASLKEGDNGDDFITSLSGQRNLSDNEILFSVDLGGFGSML